jgi:PKD repeat protein
LAHFNAVSVLIHWRKAMTHLQPLHPCSSRSPRIAAAVRRATRLAAGLLLAAWLGTAFAQPARPVDLPPMPHIQLSVAKARGQQAIDLLGSRLPEVAAAHGMSTAELAQRLRTDRTLWIDRNGRLLYIDEHLPPPAPANAAPAASSPSSLASPAPLDQTFLLHSRPGAKRTLYLDFNGHTVTGTAWNSSYGLAAINSPAFDLDGFPSTFSTPELERIQAIWQRVSEDYAPFDVDITTEEPPPDSLIRSTSADDVYGARVVITKDFTAATANPCGCGGFAYLSVFNSVNNAYYQPAYVFYDKLGSGNEKYVAEAISHEAGHNLGLSHDGTPTTGYYTGHGSGATGWAPIMGVGYYQALVQWSKGEYPNANQPQDDFVVMQQRGAPLRADDHGDTAGAATPLASTSSGGVQNLSGTGVISTRGDVDVFSFQAGAGAASLTVTGATPSSNLDASIALRDVNGNLVGAVANPVDALGATISVNLPAAGQYFLSVDGVGKGDLTAGYSDYGSVGQYQISGTAPLLAGTPPLASASATPTSGTAPLAVSFSGAASSDPDGAIVQYQWNFGDGSAPATGVAVAHSYTGAGSYSATLVVTDNSGLTGMATVPVTVTAPVNLVPVSVSDITLTVKTYKNGQANAVAKVSVKDGNGNRVSGLTVTGKWSGIVSGTASATTSSQGAASFTSARVLTSGSFTFSVTGISGTGYTYDASKNVETSDSISR